MCGRLMKKQLTMKPKLDESVFLLGYLVFACGITSIFVFSIICSWCRSKKKKNCDVEKPSGSPEDKTRKALHEATSSVVPVEPGPDENIIPDVLKAQGPEKKYVEIDLSAMKDDKRYVESLKAGNPTKPERMPPPKANVSESAKHQTLAVVDYSKFDESASDAKVEQPSRVNSMQPVLLTARPSLAPSIQAPLKKPTTQYLNEAEPQRRTGAPSLAPKVGKQVGTMYVGDPVASKRPTTCYLGQAATAKDLGLEPLITPTSVRKGRQPGTLYVGEFGTAKPLASPSPKLHLKQSPLTKQVIQSKFI